MLATQHAPNPESETQRASHGQDGCAVQKASKVSDQCCKTTENGTLWKMADCEKTNGGG